MCISVPDTGDNSPRIRLVNWYWNKNKKKH